MTIFGERTFNELTKIKKKRSHVSGLSVTAVFREENEPGRGVGGGGQKPAEK